MKRTPQDDAFIAQFTRELGARYSAAKRRGTTDQEFAESIGVTRAQLDKYLLGQAMPSVRTVALAIREHDVRVPYGGVPIHRSLSRLRARKSSANPAQLQLPFSMLSEGPETIGVRFKPMSARNFEIQLTVRKVV